MRASLLLLLALTGCVVKYGAPPDGVTATEPREPPADFGEVEDRIEVLLDTADDDVDRRDRLLSGLSLVRRARRLEPDAQNAILAYLQEIVAIEERVQPMSSPVLIGGVGQGPVLVPIDEEPLEDESLDEESLDEESPATAAQPAGDEPATAEPPDADPTRAVPGSGDPPSSAAPVLVGTSEDLDPPGEADDPPRELLTPPGQPADADPVEETAALLEQAALELDAGRPGAALKLLETCLGRPCWVDVGDQWELARDAYVSEVREREGERYLASRELTDVAERAAALSQIRERLAELLDRYPDATLADAIHRNVELVSRELEGLQAP